MESKWDSPGAMIWIDNLHPDVVQLLSDLEFSFREAQDHESAPQLAMSAVIFRVSSTYGVIISYLQVQSGIEYLFRNSKVTSRQASNEISLVNHMLAPVRG